MSLILGIDSSSKEAQIGLVSEDGVQGACSASHSANAEELLLVIQEVCAGARKKLSDITLVSVAVGPGSFTGIRTGIATAQGLRAGIGIPVLGVSVLLARILPMLGKNQYLMPYQTASAKESFYGVFSCERFDASSAQTEHTRSAPFSSAEGWRVELCSEVDVIESTELDSVLRAEESRLGTSVCAFCVDFPGELFQGDSANPGVLLAETAYLQFLKEGKLQQSSMHYQQGSEGFSLCPMYIKKAAAKTIEERRALRASST